MLSFKYIWFIVYLFFYRLWITFKMSHNLKKKSHTLSLLQRWVSDCGPLNSDKSSNLSVNQVTKTFLIYQTLSIQGADRHNMTESLLSFYSFLAAGGVLCFFSVGLNSVLTKQSSVMMSWVMRAAFLFFHSIVSGCIKPNKYI